MSEDRRRELKVRKRFSLHSGFHISGFVFCLFLAASLFFPFSVYAGNDSTVLQTATLQPTQQQMEQLQRLSPAQREALEKGLGITGGTLTPEAVKTLKEMPGFKGLTPENIEEGRKLLEKKKTVIKERKEAGAQEAVKKGVVGREKRARSLFDRFRTVGTYQGISTDLRPFGYEFFREASLMPRQDISVTSDYIVGPGDEIRLMLWGRINAQYALTVDREGNINIPEIGPLSVAGMRFADMKKFIVQNAEQIVGAKANVTMGDLKSIQVFVLGEVKRPGSYTLDSFSTIINAVLAAGGPTEIGSLRNIRLKRSNSTIVVMDFYDLLLKGDKFQDKVLQSGDVVFVPTVGPLVGIAGNVKRPAIYELKGKYDLQNLFELAGGIIPTAYTQQIQVERIQKNEKQVVIDIDDKDLTKSKDVILQDADLVKVFSIVEEVKNVVYLNGNVRRAGKYELKPGMRIRDLIKDENDLLKETYFNYALVKRLTPTDREEKLIPFDLGKVIFYDDAENNIELQPEDSVYIFSKWFFFEKPFVTVEGEVRNLKTGRDSGEALEKSAKNIRMKLKLENLKSSLEDLKSKAEELKANETTDFEKMKLGIEALELKIRKEELEATKTSDRVRLDLIKNFKVRDAILSAGNLTKDAYLEKGEILRRDEDGTVTRIYFNVEKAMAEDPKENILLQAYDRIIIHSIWEEKYKQTVSIEGDVLNPGIYEFTDGMKVGDLVFAAGNVLESAYLDEVEISSQVVKGGKSVREKYRTINLKKALSGDPDNNLSLKPYDRLYIKRISEWQEELFVTITGEVRFPGKYIIKKGERLSELIERAGGYSDKAYLRGAVFMRERVRKLQQKQIDEMVGRLERELLSTGTAQIATATSPAEAKMMKLEAEQKRRFIAKLGSVKAKGRIAVQLYPPDELKETSYDIELEDGDSLYIPTDPMTIQVIGSVYSQNAFVYKKDKREYNYYIDLAGGYTKNADRDSVYILKANGVALKVNSGFLGLSWNSDRFRWEAGSGQVESGDTIVVPEKLERVAWMRGFKDITQILYQIAVSAGVVIVAF
ncbi:Capsular polysaccharide export system periplasmic protein KpsD [hydrothermal vent metagenome]|uniref:Capsular polysaccharide export system periplasmic protein KpsD n=1 Tax=hydrothermal vent metagenome TaxID=652676 RepID=A0A3B1DAX2_9ZZZZ